MIPIAANIQEAIQHFLYSTGNISCEKKGRKQICKNLMEANDFFNSNQKYKRNKVRPIKTK